MKIKINLFSKFKIFPSLFFVIYIFQYGDCNATPVTIPLWSPVVCQWGLTQCRQLQMIHDYGKEVCENFNKKNQPYLCAGTDKDTGFEACLNIIKTIPKQKRNPIDPKTDPCAAGYTICMESAFK